MKAFFTNPRNCYVLIIRSIILFIKLIRTTHSLNFANRLLVLLLLISNCFGTALGQTTYNLVTSTAGLLSGANYLIVNTTTNGTGYALGYQNTSNRPLATITVSANSITATAATTNLDVTNPYQITLGGSTGAWTLYDAVNSGYLYAGSNSSAQLKSNVAVKNWTISFLSNVAILTCTTGAYAYNILRYNSTSGLFSCYATTQASVYLYQAASPNYYWNGSNTTAYNNTWNNTGTNWSQPTSVTTLNAVWPTTAGIYNANFNSATAPTIITIPGTIVYPPSTINIGTSNYTFTTVGATAGTVASPITLNANTLTLSPISTANLVLSGAISGLGSLAINGGGTATANGGVLRLQGANSYSGISNVGASATNAAILQLDAGGTISSSSLSVSSNSQLYLNTSGITYTNAGTLTLNGNGNTINVGALKLLNPSVGTVWNGAVTLGSNAGVNISGATSTFTLGGIVTIGTNTLTKSGTGTLILNKSGNTGLIGSSIAATGGMIQLGAANVIPDATAVSVVGATFDLNGFSETIGSVSGSGTLTNSTVTPSILSVGADNLSQSFSGVIAGGGNLSIIKMGTGTQTLSGTQTYIGGLSVNNGYVAIATENNLIGTAGSVVLNGGGVATVGTININSSRNYSLGSNGGYFDATNGTMILTNPLLFSGSTTNSNLNVVGGTLQMASSNRLPTNGLGIVLNMSNITNAQLDLNGTNQTFATLNGGGIVGGNITNSTGTATLTVGNAAANYSSTYAGIIGGVGVNLIKQATGTLTLSGINTYTGTTTINAGTLALTGSLAAGNAVTVASGGTLAGTGTLAGDVALYGTISPNNTGIIGTITTGNLTLEGGGVYAIDLNNVTGVAGTNWDELVAETVTNNATVASKFTIAINGIIAGFDVNTTISWVVGTYSGIAPTTSNIIFTTNGTTAGYANYFTVSFVGNKITLTYTPIYCVPPAAQPTSLLFGTITSRSVPISFSPSVDNPDGYLIIRTISNTPPTNPVDAISYIVGTIALGGYIESVSNATSVISSGLTANTSYWYWIFSFNNINCMNGPRYNTSLPLMGTIITATPTILVDRGVLSNMNYNLGSGSSISFGYTISANNLATPSGNITITGTTDFEVSKDNSSFGGSQTLAFTSYLLVPTPIYVRLKSGLAQGGYLGEEIINTGGGAPAVNVTCNGTVSAAQAGVALAQWDMSNLYGFVDTPFLTTTASPVGVIISGLTRGVNIIPSPGIFRGWGGNNWSTSATEPGASTGVNVYFTLQVAAGYTASISSIPQFSYKRSSTGPSFGSIYYQINKGAYVLIGASGSLSFSSTSSSGANIPSIDLSGISSLQNLEGGTMVTIMIVPFYANTSVGSWYIYDQGGTTASDFTLFGTVGGIPIMTNDTSASSIVGTSTSFGLTASNSPSSFSASGLPLGMTLNITTGVITVQSTTAIGKYAITTNATNSYGTSLTANLVYVVKAALSTWVGTTADFNIANNWADNKIPLSSADIAIPLVTNFSPVLATNTVIGNLSIASGKVLDLNGNLLTINGAVTGNGTITTSSSSSLTITGVAGTINFTLGKNTISSLTITNNATVTLGNQLSIVGGFVPGSVIIGSGATLYTGGNLVIKSDIHGTARIAQSAGNIIGNVTVERYITAKSARKYSYIGSSVLTSVRNSWQQQIYISGAGSGGTPCGATTGDAGSTDKYNSNGFDVTLNGLPSMYNYNPIPVNGSRYVGILNTELSNLSPGTGYIMNIRGNRNSTIVSCTNQLETNNPTVPEEVILSATGIVQSGDVLVPLNDILIHKYTLIANPYPCEISYTAFQANNSNINNKMWTYSPFGNGNYSTFSYGIIANGANGYDNTFGNCIASGQAFFVQANTNGNVIFHESHKVNDALPNTLYFGNANLQFIRVGLKSMSNTLLDEVVIRFNKNGDKLYNSIWDVESLNTAGQVLAIVKSGKAMAIATYSDTTSTDTAQIGVNSNTLGTFRLLFNDYDGVGNHNYTLVDRFLNVSRVISVNPLYDFNITSDTASKGKNRFYIITNRVIPLPIDFLRISVTNEGRVAKVKWNIVERSTIASYQIERSSDGKLFFAIASIKVKDISSYEWIDANTPKKTNTLYYRIKVIKTDGTSSYSSIGVLPFKTGNYQFYTYPNPVKEQLNIVTDRDSTVKVISKMNIYSMVGIKTNRLEGIKYFNNPTSINVKQLAKGIYILEVVDLKGNKFNLKFIKE